MEKASNANVNQFSFDGQHWKMERKAGRRGGGVGVADAACSVGASPVIIHYPTSGKAFEEPIRPVADAVEHADVWIELAYYCSMHTPCFKKALENGVYVDPESRKFCKALGVMGY